MIKRKISFSVRVFPVVVRDQDTYDQWTQDIIFTERELDEMQSMGLSVRALIERACGRHGQEVMRIGEPAEQAIAAELDLDLNGLYEEQYQEQYDKVEAGWA